MLHLLRSPSSVAKMAKNGPSNVQIQILKMSNRTDSPDWRHFRESHVTDGEPETAVSASLQKIKSIKNQQQKIIFLFFIFFIFLFSFSYFIKSHGRTLPWHFRCGLIDVENAPHSPFASAPVCDVRDLRHGSRAYFEIKTSRQNSAW